MHNYVSTLAENGLAMAGPVRPVLAPMCTVELVSEIIVKEGQQACLMHGSFFFLHLIYSMVLKF